MLTLRNCVLFPAACIASWLGCRSKRRNIRRHWPARTILDPLDEGTARYLAAETETSRNFISLALHGFIVAMCAGCPERSRWTNERSEEHTSELQSLMRI